MKPTFDTNSPEGIAIVGMAGRFPGARDVAQFWENLVKGVESISVFREEELEHTFATPEAKAQGHQFVRARAILEDADMFDASFFNVLPREAELMDPQHRLFLECAWETLESAGWDPEQFSGMIGVYAGLSLNSYLLYNLCADRKFTADFAAKFQTGDFSTLLGNDKDFLATRVSYKLNLRGPAMAIQSACSTSLVAICQACTALLNYQCDMALAGGVSISFPQKRDYLYQEESLISADGTCRTFDAEARGTVFGHGVATLLLKRLADAVTDGDNVLAVIKGTALNNDGSAKIGYAAPSVNAQADVIAMAQAVAGVHPESISYVEAHGTGTPLGDPIEIAALTKAFREGGAQRNGYCAVGTAKTNIGHLDGASGATGLIKTVLQLQHGLITPLLHFKSPNPKIDFANSPFFPAGEAREWQRTGAEPRRAGVSAFGVGGTNAHVIVEEAPAMLSGPSRSAQLLVLSAKTDAALAAMTRNLAAHLDAHPGANLADIAFTLQRGRRAFARRRALVACDLAEAAQCLKSGDARLVTSGVAASFEPAVVFLFPGQGAQYVDMGRDLYETEAAFRNAVDQCATILEQHLGLDIRRVLYPEPAGREFAEKQMNETSFTQPSIFVVEYALASLWMSWGVKPALLIGHSIGEYVCAVLAESFTLEDALALLAARARLMQALPTGSMLAVRLGAAELKPLLPAQVSIAAVNSPSLTTVSGPAEILKEFQRALEARKTAARVLATSHAFHSEMMEPMVAPFTELAARTERSAPKIPWISTCTGKALTATELADPAYWARQLRHPVYFADAITGACADSKNIFLEVGPGHTLSQLTRQHPARAADLTILPSLAAAPERGRDLVALLAALGRLWVAGVRPDWESFSREEFRKRVPLPTYPFERKRFWVEPAAAVAAVPTPAPTTLPAFAAVNAFSASAPIPLNPAAMNSSENPKRRDSFATQIHAAIKELSGIAIESDTASFVELGFDSLFLTQASQAFQGKFGVKITFRQLLSDLNSVAALAEYLDKNLPDDQPAAAAPVAMPTGGSPLEMLLASQLQLMQAVLAQSKQPPAAIPAASPLVAGPARDSLPAVRWPGNQPPAPQGAAGPGQQFKRFGPYKPVEKGEKGGLTDRQQAALDSLITRYVAKTAKSKAYTAEHRPHFADPRAVSGFKANWKEIVYPIVSDRSLGSRIWDLDGNEYVDITMGFGTYLFGHSPDWIVAAIKTQLDRGTEIGPQSPIAGEVARLICEFTQMDRATFCNTGSEAVMAAIRLARCVTGRRRVVYFTGDYHGMFEEVLVRGAWVDGEYRSQPIAPGMPANLAENMLVLEYGAPESLEIIRKHAHEIAAVLVEPVQSRHPDLQPKEFLLELRAITERSGSALIFDEVVTGFRCHPGGAQAYFGVKADLATYGKVIGGGLPIGVLAGKRKYLDALDGGQWNYGDDSFPEVGMTFFAGTFVRHPLAMAAASVVLKHLKAQGPYLQQRLTERVARACRVINEHLESIQVPVRLPHFSAVAMIDYPPDLKFGSLLWYYLREKGVHVWEGRPCIFTLALTDDDFDHIIFAFKDAVADMQEAGFLPVGPMGIVRPAPLGQGSGEFPRIDVAPITEAQKEIFFSVQMGDEANCAYNEASVIHFDGALNISALERALFHLIERHPALRSTFSPDGDRQLFHSPPSELKLPVEDLTLLPEAERNPLFKLLREAETKTAFDLVAGPLLRLKLVRFSATRHAMLYTAHHLVCDGWSIGMIFQELCAIYNALVAHRIPLLPPAMPFGDYSRLLEAQKTGKEFKKAEEYWFAQFRDGAPVLELPTDRPRPAIKSYAAALESRPMAGERLARLKKATPQLGGTLFTTLLGAFATLLHRLTGQDDVVIGIPAAGQTMVGCSELVGHCLNFLPLRLQPLGDTPFTTFARKVQQRVLDAYDHQQMTYGTMVQKLKLPRDTSRLPLVSVMFNIDKSGLDLQKFTELDFHVATNPKQFTNFELFFNLVQQEHSLDVECEYNTDLFDRETVRAWLEAFEMLVEGVILSGQTTLDQLPLLGGTSMPQSLNQWQGRVNDFPRNKTLHALFADHVARTPSKVAVRCGTHAVTYSDLDQASSQLAAYLQSLGARPGVLVGVCVERSVAMVVGLLGILKSGAAYVPLDPAFPAERLGWMIEDAAMPVIVTQSSLASKLPPHQARLVCLDQPNFQSSSSSDSDLRSPISNLRSPCPEDLAYVIFTSGSTGRPKGVQIPHRAVVNFLESMRREPGLVPEDVLLSVTTLSFDIAGLELFLPLTTGATVVIASRETTVDGHLLRQELDACGATIMQATPVTWRLLLEAGWPGSPQLKILVGGEAVPRELVNQLAPRCASLWNMYGPTETTVWSTTGRLGTGEGPVSIGHPIDNTQVYIVNRQLQLQPVGVPGELLIGGAGLAVGYLQRPELTAEKFILNPLDAGRVYRTGDLAKWRVDGTIECLGRLDHQVKIRGYRIELGEVEATLNRHPSVRECAVAAVPGVGGITDQLAAYVVPREAASTSADADVSLVTESMDQWDEQYTLAINEGGPEAGAEGSANVRIHKWFGSAKVEAEVNEWIAQTVRQLEQLRPKRVLELGCGAGMVTLQLAPQCEEYWASDFSQAAVDNLTTQVQRAGDALRHVRVFKGGAHETEELPSGFFDAVVINSVIEYFPSVDYLLNVIDGALRVIGPKGFIFFGDVPNFALRQLFHYCRQLDQAEASAPDRDTVIRQAESQLAHDTRLMCAPEFFYALPHSRPLITKVEVRMMPGIFEVPATTLHIDTHSDVFLFVGDHPQPPSVDWRVWQDEYQLDAVSRWLESRPAILGLAGVVSRRLSTRFRELKLLRAGEKPGSWALLKREAELNATGVDLDELRRLVVPKGYGVHITWSTDAADSRCDVILRATLDGGGDSGLLPVPPRRSEVRRLSLQSLASNPLHTKLAGRLIPKLRAELEQRLPAYMIPGVFMLLDALPLTPNGKVDRKALPAPDFSSQDRTHDFVAPRTPMEQRLAEIWAGLLQLERVGVTDNFFDLGGHSLLAVKLFAEIERRLGIKLPLATLFAKASIEHLAKVLEARETSEDRWKSLVPIQLGGSRAPLFFVHGAGGNVLLYRDLVQHLGADYTVYGFQSRGLDGTSQPLTTIDEMADAYVTELKEEHPHGPYRLAGYCLGGVIAYQMARLLRQIGDEVALVALLDTYNPAAVGDVSHVSNLLQRARFHAGNVAQLGPVQLGRYVREKLRLARDGELANLLGLGDGPPDSQSVAITGSDIDPGGNVRIQQINDQADRTYRPQVYEGKIVVFKPKVNYSFLPDPQLGWGDLAKGVEVVELPVNPHAMLVEPFVAQLAAALKLKLEASANQFARI